MFRLTLKRVITRPVVVNVPLDGSDKFKKYEFRWKFRLPDEAEIKALNKKHQEAERTDDTYDRSAVMIRTVSEDILDVEDENTGVAVPYSTELVDALIGQMNVKVAMMKTYTEAQIGEAVAKN